LQSIVANDGQPFIFFLFIQHSNDNGGSKAQASLKDTELINQFKKISALPDDEKNLVLKMITAYIRDFNTQQAYAS
jgi:hypothetical protein